MTIRKSELVRVARELNTVLGLDPQIAVDELRMDELKVAILEASKLIDPNDRINRRSISLIEDLRVEAEALQEKDSFEGIEDSLEEEVLEEEEIEEEEEEEGQKEETSEEEEKEEKTPKKQPKKTAVTWPQALAQAIRATEGYEFTGEEIIRDAVTIYEMANGVQVERDQGARVQWQGARYVLTHLGVIVPVKREGQWRTIVYKYQKCPEV